MNIQEATRKAIESNGYITCTSEFWHGIIKIEPTNTPDCCILFKLDDKDALPQRGWQQQARHLLSDDWAVVD